MRERERVKIKIQTKRVSEGRNLKKYCNIDYKDLSENGSGVFFDCFEEKNVKED